MEHQPAQLPIVTIDVFKEINCGQCTGLTKDEIATRFPELVQEWAKNTDPSFPNGENLRSVEARAIPTVKDIITSHNNRTILLSGHGSLNVAIISYFLQIPLAIRFKIRQDNCCVNILEFTDNQLNSVKGINITPKTAQKQSS